jgi:ATP-dependent protease HslVU (ClpYQ) peptidase subunit
MIIVSDSQVSDEDSSTKSYDCKKVFELEDGSLLGVAGDIRSEEAVIEWFNKGKPKGDKPEIKEEHDCDFILMNDDGLFISDRTLEFWRVDNFDGIGSGQAIAFGAMKLGHSAEEAVWVAAQIDLHTGGDIKIYELGKKPKTYRKQ